MYWVAAGSCDEALVWNKANHVRQLTVTDFDTPVALSYAQGLQSNSHCGWYPRSRDAYQWYQVKSVLSL